VSTRSYFVHRSASVRTREGATVVLGIVFIGATCTLLAFSVNVCRLHWTRSQLQAAADSGVLAATAKLRAVNSELITFSYGETEAAIDKARMAAQQMVAANAAAHCKPSTNTPLRIDPNLENVEGGAIVFGQVDGGGQGFTPTTRNPNSVMVRVGFTPEGLNGSLGILFGGLLGMSSTSMICESKAMTRIPTLLPFVVYEPQWDSMQGGNGRDDFAIAGETLKTGSDGILEVAVFPNDWDGLDMPPGNFGWVDLSSETGTDGLCRIVDQGPSEDDLASIGGPIEAGETLSGTTGFRSAAEVAFVGGNYNGQVYQGILGQPRYVAIYDFASGSGTNATFRITKFAMVRVVYANLDSTPKAIVIQPVHKREALERVWLVQ
jgi:Putative Flp pilus-assembly TadE/G-like